MAEKSAAADATVALEEKRRIRDEAEWSGFVSWEIRAIEAKRGH